MKNISSINLGGRVISIEDKAWQIHMAYIEMLYQYFIKEEGCFEIINDIENRVSELMQALINKHNSFINKTDVEHIIRVIGTADEIKELDNDDWDTVISTSGHSNACNGIGPVRSIFMQTEKIFPQPGEPELCPN